MVGAKRKASGATCVKVANKTGNKRRRTKVAPGAKGLHNSSSNKGRDVNGRELPKKPITPVVQKKKAVKKTIEAPIEEEEAQAEEEDVDFFADQDEFMSRLASSSLAQSKPVKVDKKEQLEQQRKERKKKRTEAIESDQDVDEDRESEVDCDVVMDDDADEQSDEVVVSDEDDESDCVVIDDDESDAEEDDVVAVARVMGGDVASKFEDRPRTPAWAAAASLPQRLPVRTADGKLSASKIGQADARARKTAVKESTKCVAPVEDLAAAPDAVPLIVEQAHVRSHRLRVRIGVISQSICEAPEQHISLIDELFEMLSDGDSVIRELSLLSQVAIFIDIAPGYPIRPPSDSELNTKLSKDVRKLWKYESAVLSSYRRLIDHLRGLVKRTQRNKNQMDSAHWRLGATAVRGVSELLRSLFHFNFAKELIICLVPLVNHPFSKAISDVAATAIRDVIARPNCGDHAIEAVRIIAKIIEDSRFKVRPALLQCFLVLPLRLVKSANKDDKDHKKKRGGHSKNKLAADIEAEKELKRDMDAAKATQSQAKYNRIQLQLLQLVFKTYFTALKSAPDSQLLPVVLEGLAKFAHLINVELVLDLLACLRQLMDNNTLQLPSILFCILAAFQMLCAQGNAIMIDAREFYQRLYVEMDQFADPTQYIHLPAFFDCIDFMFIKRRQISIDRVGAFIKKMTNVALHLPAAESLGVLHSVHTLLGRYPMCSRLLDNEPTTGGIYRNDVDDPEHANPFASTLWELSAMQDSFHPAVSKYARMLASQETFSVDQLRRTPAELMGVYLERMITPSLPWPSAPSDRKRSARIRDFGRSSNADNDSLFARLNVEPSPSDEEIRVGSLQRQFRQQLFRNRLDDARAQFDMARK